MCCNGLQPSSAPALNLSEYDLLGPPSPPSCPPQAVLEAGRGPSLVSALSVLPSSAPGALWRDVLRWLRLAMQDLQKGLEAAAGALIRAGLYVGITIKGQRGRRGRWGAGVREGKREAVRVQKSTRWLRLALQVGVGWGLSLPVRVGAAGTKERGRAPSPVSSPKCKQAASFPVLPSTTLPHPCFRLQAPRVRCWCPPPWLVRR